MSTYQTWASRSIRRRIRLRLGGIQPLFNIIRPARFGAESAAEFAEFHAEFGAESAEFYKTETQNIILALIHEEELHETLQ